MTQEKRQEMGNTFFELASAACIYQFRLAAQDSYTLRPKK